MTVKKGVERSTCSLYIAMSFITALDLQDMVVWCTLHCRERMDIQGRQIFRANYFGLVTDGLSPVIQPVQPVTSLVRCMLVQFQYFFSGLVKIGNNRDVVEVWIVQIDIYAIWSLLTSYSTTQPFDFF